MKSTKNEKPSKPDVNMDIRGLSATLRLARWRCVNAADLAEDENVKLDDSSEDDDEEGQADQKSRATVNQNRIKMKAMLDIMRSEVLDSKNKDKIVKN